VILISEEFPYFFVEQAEITGAKEKALAKVKKQKRINLFHRSILKNSFHFNPSADICHIILGKSWECQDPRNFYLKFNLFS
jgi:hypothetical protein